MNDRVIASLENPHGDRCVDIFVRNDGSFGFEEFRRDAEDCGAWQPLNTYSRLVFASNEDALASARRYITWFSQLHVASSR